MQTIKKVVKKKINVYKTFFYEYILFVLITILTYQIVHTITRFNYGKICTFAHEENTYYSIFNKKHFL